MRNFTPSPSFVAAPPISHNQRVDEAYVEYCNRVQAGEKLDPDDFCLEHPTIQASLLRLILVGQIVEQDSSLFRRIAYGWPEVGTVYLGQFELRHQIGAGAFSRVYLATEILMGHRWVVLKVSPHASSEALCLGRAAHPNVVEIYSVDTDEDNELSAICMPLQGYTTLLEVLDQVRSTTTLPQSAAFLRELAARTPAGLPAVRDWSSYRRMEGFRSYVDAVRHLAVQILDALANVHAQGIVHSDLKPSNILLTPGASPLLIDFNLAADDHQDFTRLGGTLFYMSQEQIRHSLQPSKDAKATPHSDLYSLGVILFELLTGNHPFGPLPTSLGFAELRNLLQERQQTVTPRVRDANPDVDPDFAAFIEQCLSPDPAQRPSSAQAAHALLAQQVEAPEAVPNLSAVDSVAERSEKSRPRANRKALLRAAVALLAMFGVSSASLPPSPTDFQKGVVASQKKQWDKAVVHFSRALSGGADNIKVLKARGFALLRIAEQDDGQDLKRFAAARGDLSDVHLSCGDAESKIRLAYAFQGKGDQNAARHLYEEAIQSGNRQASVLNNLGFALVRANEIDLALAMYSDAIAENPKHPVPLLNRAKVFFNQAINSNDASIREDLLRLAAADCRSAIDLSKSGSRLGFYAVVLAWQNENDPTAGWKLIRPVLAEAAAHGFDLSTIYNDRLFPKSLRSQEEFQKLKVLRVTNHHLNQPSPLMSPLDD